MKGEEEDGEDGGKSEKMGKENEDAEMKNRKDAEETRLKFMIRRETKQQLLRGRGYRTHTKKKKGGWSSGWGGKGMDADVVRKRGSGPTWG